MRPILTKLGLLVKTCNVSQTSGLRQHIRNLHYFTDLINKTKIINVNVQRTTINSFSSCSTIPSHARSCRYFVPLSCKQNSISSEGIFTHSRLFYSTQSEERKEMTEDEKQLYKAIQSEADSSPIENKLLSPKKKMKKSVKFKDKMVENLNYPNVTVYSVGRIDLTSLREEFENDDLYVVCQLPPEFNKEVLMVRSKNKKQDGTYTDAFFLRSFGVACWAMNQHQGEELVKRAMHSKDRTLYDNSGPTYQEIIDNREVFRTIQALDIKRIKDRISMPTVTDASLLDEKASYDMALKKCTFSKALLQSVTLGRYEEMLSDFIENRGLERRTEELKHGHGSNMNSNNVYTGFGEISSIRYQINLSDLFDEDPDEYWEFDDLQGLYTDMVTYLSIYKRIREVNKNLDYCEALIKLFNDRLTDKHHVNLERIIIVLIFIEILIELIRYFPYLMGLGLSTDMQETNETKHS